MGLLPISAFALGEGEVSLTMTAQPVPDTERTYDITVRVEARDVLAATTSVDVVLVIDVSGSMWGTRLADAKAAGIGFVNALLNPANTATYNPNARVAVVAFESDASVVSGFTQDFGLLQAGINGLVTSGGTFTQAGVYEARNLLQASLAARTCAILLSDGVPSDSYRTILGVPANWTSYSGSMSLSDGAGIAVTDPWVTSPTATDFDYSSSTGSAFLWEDGYDPAAVYFSYRDNATLAEANLLKGEAERLYTIALGAGSAGTTLLASMASPGCAYATPDSSQLDAIYQEIAGAITIPAISGASLVDTMAQGVDVVGGASSIAVTAGSIAYDEATKRIDWNIGTLGRYVDPVAQPGLRFEELTYRVVLASDMTGVPSAPSGSGTYFTNNITELSYTDHLGVSKTLNGDSPVVAVEPPETVTPPTTPDETALPPTSDASGATSLVIAALLCSAGFAALVARRVRATRDHR
jgi:hypothetical protein